MSDDTRPSTDDPAVVEHLREEVRRLRSQIESEVRTRSVVVVDETGVERIRLAAEADGCRVTLLASDGFDRVVLEGEPEHGALRISGRSDGEGPTRVDLFAVDPEDEQGVYVGVELIDDGNSVAGFTVVQARPARTWTARS